MKVKANGNWQYRQVVSQDGVGGQNSLTQFFGLNNATTVDSIIIYWPSGYKQEVANLSINSYYAITEPSANLVKGIAFGDLNNNCILDGSEYRAANQTFTFNPGNIKVTTDDSGKYQLWLKPGTYTIQHSTSSIYQASSCMSGYQLTFSGVGQTVNASDFALTVLQNNPDLEVGLYAKALRKGLRNSYTFKVCNNGSKAGSNVTLNVTIPTKIVPINFTTAYTSVTIVDATHKKYSWDIASVDVNECNYITMTDSVSTSSTIGDSIIVNAEARLANNDDANNADNSIDDPNLVVGSIDPNALVAYTNGNNQTVIENQVITYKVEFQNVGNAEAQNVKIAMPISDALDLASITGIVGSHHFSSYIENKILYVNLININLPDSATSQNLSNGFIQFNIQVKTNMTVGTIISEYANIVFDYNEPMATNTVMHSIYSKEVKNSDANAGSLVIYPNPTSGRSMIYANPENVHDKKPVFQKIFFTNYIGQEYEISSLNEHFSELDFSKFSCGIYFIKAYDTNGKMYLGKLVVEK